MVNPLLSDDDKKDKKDTKKRAEPLVKKISDPPQPPSAPVGPAVDTENQDKNTQEDNSSLSTSKDTVLVSEDEIEAQEESNQEHIAKQIEALTGEIQALESRIERLTGGNSAQTTIAPNSLSTSPIEATAQTAGNEKLPVNNIPSGSVDIKSEEISKAQSSDNIPAQTQTQDSKSSLKPVSPVPAPPVPPSVAKPPTVPVAVASPVNSTVKEVSGASQTAPSPVAPKPQSAVTDIYSKLEKQQKNQLDEIENPKPLPSGGSDIAGTSGEVLIVIGVILMVLLLGSPLFISGLGADFKDLIRIVGWPAVSGCLVIGFILSMFKMGKWVIKIFSLIMMLIGLAITLAVFGNPAFLGPLNTFVRPLLEFYQ